MLRKVFLACLGGMVSVFLFSQGSIGEGSAQNDPPKWISLTEENGAIVLRWFRVQGAVSYILEKKVGEEGDYGDLAVVNNPIYTDRKIEPGRFYFYRLRGLHCCVLCLRHLPAPIVNSRRLANSSYGSLSQKSRRQPATKNLIPERNSSRHRKRHFCRKSRN